MVILHHILQSNDSLILNRVLQEDHLFHFQAHFSMIWCIPTLEHARIFVYGFNVLIQVSFVGRSIFTVFTFEDPFLIVNTSNVLIQMIVGFCLTLAFSKHPSKIAPLS